MHNWIPIAIGAAFILIGIIALFWGRAETRRYYEALSNRMDVREFLERSPIRPEPEALKIGGILSIAVGLVILLIGIIWG